MIALLALVVAVTPSERATTLLSRIPTENVIQLLYGEGWWPASGYVGSTPPLPQYKIPAIFMNDGPQGFRTGGSIRGSVAGTSTQFPSGLTVAATWDPETAFTWGAAMGEEFADKGATIQLGPGLNVARVPTDGRNFEYISGEEPVLGSSLAAAAIRGVQSKGVMANAKHWVLNNQETKRMKISDDASE